MSQTFGKIFQKQITLAKLFDMFPDNKTAEKWFESRIWKGDKKCPTCGNGSTTITRHSKTPYYTKCRSHFSAKKGTVMQQSKTSCQNWAIAAYMIATNMKNISSMKLHRDLGIGQKAAWFMVHRLRSSLKQLAGVDGMEWHIETDEVYFNSIEKNRHIQDTHRQEKPPLSMAGVKAVFADETSFRPIVEAKPRLEYIIDSHIDPTTAKDTDENPAYGDRPNHENAKHHVGEHRQDRVHINDMQSPSVTVSQRNDEIFHRINEAHRYRRINRFGGCHNRGANTVDLIGTISQNVTGNRLTYMNCISLGNQDGG